MKRYIFILTIAIVLLHFISCKIEIATTPSLQEVKGSWTALDANINVNAWGQSGSIAFDSSVMVLSSMGNLNLICGNPRTGTCMAADAGLQTGYANNNSFVAFDNRYLYVVQPSNIYRRPKSDFSGM